MKILFMADVPPNPDSGAAGTEVQTIQALRELGHKVDEVWFADLPHRIRHGNLHSLLEQPRAYKRVMMAKLRDTNYDVVHANQPHGYLAARALKRIENRPVFIHRSHGFEARAERDLKPWKKIYECDRRPVFRRLLSKPLGVALGYNNRAIARHADAHIVSASECADFLRDGMGVPPERIAVIPQAAPPAFTDAPAAKMDADRLNRVLYASQFAFFKAPMIVALVVNEIAAHNPALQFAWVCPREHHPAVLELLSPSIRRNRITLLDWMPQEELLKTYDRHGIFLFPSFFEGFGKAFIEAMARGLCVVAADNAGAKDVITSGKDGFLTPTGDANLMVERCLLLNGNHELARQMSSEAARTARNYSWARVAKETAAFYENRLSERKRQTESNRLEVARA